LLRKSLEPSPWGRVNTPAGRKPATRLRRVTCRRAQRSDARQRR
jgi:hypothetical protein